MPNQTKTAERSKRIVSRKI